MNDHANDKARAMDGHSTDDLRALRAADPAADVGAPQALHDRVAAIPTADAPTAAAPIRPLRRWLAPVAAAAALVVAVGGGYVWGTLPVGLGPVPVPMAVATGTPEDPAPPIGIYGDAGDGSLSEVQPGLFQGPGGLGWPRGDFDSDGRRFIVPAFEDMPGRADVYAVDALAQYSAEDAARMAAALGVGGEVHPEDPAIPGWVVGEQAGPRFILSPWSAGASYYSGIPDAVTVCEGRATALHGRDKLNEDGTWAFGQEMISCMADTPLPSDELVDESVSMFLAAIGFDEASAELTRTTDESSRTVMVTAARIVEDNVTEISAHVTVSAQGIMYASGPTGQVVSLGEYPIVSPAEAAARLSDTAFAPRLVSWPRADSEPDIGPAVEPDYTPVGPPESTPPPVVPEAGSAIPWSIAEHEIVSARRGLALTTAHGQEYLVPAYEFTAADGTMWSVLALAEDHLDTAFTPPPAE